jgi:hypothetical protein
VHRAGPGALGGIVTGGANLVRYVAIALHAFMAVILVGTMFRLVQYHLIASPNPTAQHLGRAMAIQY